MIRYKSDHDQQGYILISLLLTTMFVLVAGVATAQLALTNYNASISDKLRIAAQFAADAGADESVKLLNDDYPNDFANYNGTTTETTVADLPDMRTTYESVITPVTGDTYTRILKVTGRTYYPKTASTPNVERTYELSLRAITEGDFSVVAGVGGLIMSNSAKVLGGNLQVNGDILMSGSSQIGLSSQPLPFVTVANYNCPTASPWTTYPRECTPGENDNPITVTNPAWVYVNELKANHQTDTSRITYGSIQTTGVPKKDYPYQDRTPIKSSISTTHSGNISCNSGTLTWPPNYKVEGDVTVSSSCNIIVQGNVWITGSLRLTQSGRMTVATGLATPPVIMIDSQNGVRMENSSQLTSNPSSIGFKVITYWSTAGCSPDCTTVTGADLVDSKDRTTISLSQTSSGPNTEFVAHWTKLDMANSGGIGALAGQTISLTNSAAVTFGASVSGVNGIANWVIKDYRRSFTPL